MQDTVFALDAASGAWKWHRRRESHRDMTIRGAAAPAVVDGTVYAAWSDGWLSALDAKTGAPRWERRVAPAGDFLDLDATPQVAAGRVYVAAWSGAVAALDAATGSTVWETPLPASARLQLAGHTLVAVTAKSVVGVSTADGRPTWSLPLPGEPAGSPVAIRGMAVVPTGKALLWIDVATGRKVRELDPGSGVTASPAALGHRMYVLSNRGDLVALNLK
jgi:outer membrane protein assembly factor BamB